MQSLNGDVSQISNTELNNDSRPQVQIHFPQTPHIAKAFPLKPEILFVPKSQNHESAIVN